MQINGNSHHAASDARLDRPMNPGFRPIAPEDLTLRGIMRRIAEQNLGQSIDLQA